jgi:hypothetical protein
MKDRGKQFIGKFFKHEDISEEWPNDVEYIEVTDTCYDEDYNDFYLIYNSVSDEEYAGEYWPVDTFTERLNKATDLGWLITEVSEDEYKIAKLS